MLQTLAEIAKEYGLGVLVTNTKNKERFLIQNVMHDSNDSLATTYNCNYENILASGISPEDKDEKVWEVNIPKTEAVVTEKMKNELQFTASYIFQRNPKTKNSYILVKHKGENIEQLETNKLIRGSNKGKVFIILRNIAESRLYTRFKWCLELRGAKILAGFNDTDFAGLSFSNTPDRKYTTLIKTDYSSYLELYFVKRDKSDKNIFEDWLKEYGGISNMMVKAFKLRMQQITQEKTLIDKIEDLYFKAYQCVKSQEDKTMLLDLKIFATETIKKRYSSIL